MKKTILVFILIAGLSYFLFCDTDFCDQTVLVVLNPKMSEFNGSLDISFFGTFAKVSVENIFQIHDHDLISNLTSIPGYEFRSIYMITLPSQSKALVLSAIEELMTIEGIDFAKPNYISTPTIIPNDEYWDHPGLWSLHGTHGVKAPEAWDLTQGSRDVRVGVMDTGIATHPDLNNNVDATLGKNFVLDNFDILDTHSHGTLTAGVVGAVGNNSIGIVGVNWRVTLVPLRISLGGWAKEGDMIKAVEWATNLWGTENEIPILNMSFSGYGTLTALRSAICNYPGLFTWSAGNTGTDVDEFLDDYGSFNLNNLIAVGAINSDGERAEWDGIGSSSYSLSGENVHVFAPGADGYFTSINNEYDLYGGTSMAAPHAAGVAALLLSIDPSLGASEIKTIITSHADPIEISIPGGTQIVNRLNAYKAALSILQEEIVIGPDDCLQNAIDMCAPGGVIILESGTYTSLETFFLSNKDITIRGSLDDRAFIKGKFVISNVSSNTLLENLVFEPTVSNDGFKVIELINATPTLNNLVFNLDNDFHSIAVYAEIDTIDHNVLYINSSIFHKGQGIFFTSATDIETTLYVTNSSFMNNFGDSNSVSGTAIHFLGGNLYVADSEFKVQGVDLSSILGDTETVKAVVNNSVLSKTIRFTDNKFITNLEGLQLINTDIVVTGADDYNFYLERNIFTTSFGAGYTPNHSRIRLDSSPNPTGFRSFIFQNTDIMLDSYVPYNFLKHSSKTTIKNNLLTGNIAFVSPILENKVTFNWFVEPQEFPNNINITHHNNFFGDPNIDPVSLQPIWNETIKSGLIEAGDPDTNENGILWWEDKDDQDIYGNRFSIGAVLPIQYGWMLYSLSNFPDTAPLSNPQNISWVSFPFLDKLFTGLIKGHPATELYYELHLYNDNSLLFDDTWFRVLDNIQWQYDGASGSVYFDLFWDTLTGEYEHLLDSRHGYKIQMLPYKSKNIIVSGFLAELYGNNEDNLVMKINPGELETWVGYYKLKSESPLVALDQIEPYLTEIKTQRWSMNKDSNGEWRSDRGNPRFNFGEAVSLKYIVDQEILFTWNVENNSSYPSANTYYHPVVQHFNYTEQMDYIPLYIYLPDDMSHEGIGEIGIFIDDVCYGAEVIMGDVVQINGYFIELDVDEADIEFRFYEYNNRSFEKKIVNYSVWDTEQRMFLARSLNLKEKEIFYIVSLREENGDNKDVPSKTFLEGNFPNPFNPSTTIRYSLAQTESVNLTIYNVRGQLVKTLVNETQEAGRHSVEWYGDNEQKNKVASGIYFYKFETSVGTDVQRMLLLK